MRIPMERGKDRNKRQLELALLRVVPADSFEKERVKRKKEKKRTIGARLFDYASWPSSPEKHGDGRKGERRQKEEMIGVLGRGKLASSFYEGYSSRKPLDIKKNRKKGGEGKD